MQLKNVNPNSGNIVVNNPINIKFYFLEIVRIELKNEHHMLYSQENIIIAQKNNSSYSLSH
jgi:hypothetical protein